MPARPAAESSATGTATPRPSDEMTHGSFLAPSGASNRSSAPLTKPSPSSSPVRGLKLLIPSSIRRSFDSTSDNQHSTTPGSTSRSSILSRTSPISERNSSRSKHSSTRLFTLWGRSHRGGATTDGDKSSARVTDEGASVANEQHPWGGLAGGDEACFMEEGRSMYDSAERNLLTRYPYEILLKVITHLELQDVITLRSVSKTIASLTHEQHMWKQLYLNNKGWRIYEPPGIVIEQPPSQRDSSRRRSLGDLNGLSWMHKNKTRSPVTPTTLSDSFKDSINLSATSETIAPSPVTKSSRTTPSKHRGKLNKVEQISPTYEELLVERWNWEQIYTERLLLEERWRKGEPTSMNCIPAHAEAIYCSQVIHDRIITGSRDKSIKFWSIKLGSIDPPELVYTIEDAHARSVLCFLIDPLGCSGGGYCLSGSSDATIAVWDLRGVLAIKPGEKCKQKPMKTKVLHGHEEGVLDLTYNEDKIVSCSKDETVRIWNRATYEVLHVLRRHTNSPVNCIAIQAGTTLLLTAAGNGRIIQWNLKTGKYERQLRAAGTAGVACMIYKASLLFFGTADNSMVIMNPVTREHVKKAQAHDELVRAVAYNVDRKIMCSASYDETVKLWHVNGHEMTEIGECDVTHQGMVFSLVMSPTQIISTSHDSTMAVQDFAGGLKYAALFA